MSGPNIVSIDDEDQWASDDSDSDSSSYRESDDSSNVSISSEEREKGDGKEDNYNAEEKDVGDGYNNRNEEEDEDDVDKGDDDDYNDDDYNDDDYNYDDDDDDDLLEDEDLNDDYRDYEMGENPDRFEDEEVSFHRDFESYRASEDFDDDGGSKMVNDGEWWEGREKLIAMVVVGWCCLCLIIMGVVVGVMVGGKNKNERNKGYNDVTPMPTPHPTFAPQPLPPSLATAPPVQTEDFVGKISFAPTAFRTNTPTLSPTASAVPTITVPETVTIVANQDTYVNLSEEKLKGDEHGKMESFLVQNGPVLEESIPDAVALISFPLDKVPAFGRLDTYSKNANLRLTHVAHEGDEEDSAAYTIVRIPDTRMAVEFYNGYFFLPPEDDADGVKVGPKFEVKPKDVVIDIDITELVFDYELEPGKEPKQILLMIQNRGAEQYEGGDRFYSRETSYPPKLMMDFDGGKAANVEEPNIPNLVASEFEDEASDESEDFDFDTGKASENITALEDLGI